MIAYARRTELFTLITLSHVAPGPLQDDYEKYFHRLLVLKAARDEAEPPPEAVAEEENDGSDSGISLSDSDKGAGLAGAGSEDEWDADTDNDTGAKAETSAAAAAAEVENDEDPTDEYFHFVEVAYKAFPSTRPELKYMQPRSLQAEVVDSGFKRQDMVAVMAMGAGKLLAAILAAFDTDGNWGIALHVSPLTSLAMEHMKVYNDIWPGSAIGTFIPGIVGGRGSAGARGAWVNFTKVKVRHFDR